jgi:dimeric dUTPase (all-alpha-NTP-PPase superfamily)
MGPTESQLSGMLELQIEINSRINPEWLGANYNWHRAIHVKVLEAIEIHDWKWWKQPPAADMNQLRMDLVDIWHFTLSTFLQDKHGNATLALKEMMAEFKLSQKSVTFDNKYFTLSQIPKLDKLDLLGGLAAAKRVNLALFDSLLSDCEMSWSELFKHYIAKNILNFFRQDHGYKEGTYIDTWDYRKDNENLIELLEKLDFESSNVRHELYQLLEEKYILAATFEGVII